jgi:hypothetical protein
VVVAGLLALAAMVVAGLVVLAVMMVATVVMVLAGGVVAAVVTLVMAGGVVGAVRGQRRAGAAQRQDQDGGGRRCGSLQHLCLQFSDEWIGG